MARRGHARPVDGWLLLDKPAGVTSAAAVAKARWAFDARKAGHAGTLDPAATGLLAIAFGSATKTVPYVTEAAKCYRFTLRWGAATATDDAEGAVIDKREARPDAAAIEAALPEFRGDIVQVPPQVSAVKVAGARAYALARAGETVELAPRPLRVDRLDLVQTLDRDRAVFEMVCGKGGYVRSLGRDLGQALGCLAHVEALRRVWSGPFHVDEAIGWASLGAEARGIALDPHLLPVTAGLAGLPEIAVAPATAGRIAQGNPVALPQPVGLAEGAAVWASLNGRALAVGCWRGGAFRPSRVLAGN